MSDVYHAPMVDPGRVFLWTWDARPFPVFPNAGETWRDAANHATGHWLNGRLGAMASDELAIAVAADYGVALGEVAAAGPLLTGVLSGAGDESGAALAHGIGWIAAAALLLAIAGHLLGRPAMR